MSIDVSEFNKNGSVLLKGFFSNEEIDNVRNDAKRVFLAQMLKLGILDSSEVSESEFEASLYKYFERDQRGFMNCGKQIQHLISLHRLSLKPGIEDTLRALGMEFPNISTRPVLYFNSPRLAEKEVYWRVFPHQDWRSMQGSLDSIIVWVPLIDIDRRLGALEVIDRSHRLGLVAGDLIDSFGKVEEVSDDDFTEVEVEKGDALFFSAFLVHRSGTNSTGSIRWSCHFRYNNLNEATFIERGYPHPYIYRPQEELITPDFPSKDLLAKVFS
jgi:phytanoyl-CoA hydroxylase